MYMYLLHNNITQCVPQCRHFMSHGVYCIIYFTYTQSFFPPTSLSLSLSLSLSPSLPSPLLPPPPQDPKRHLEEKVDAVLTSNITQSLGAMLDTVVFT